jgi:hypothetical protein
MLTSANQNEELSDTSFITSVYELGLGREPDAAGLAYWENELSSGALSEYQIIEVMKNSAIANGEVYTPFAKGGIVTSPTVGLIGEAGYSEAVIPLKNPNDPLNQNAVIMMLKKIEERLEAAERMAVKQTATQIKTLDTQRAILGEAIGA